MAFIDSSRSILVDVSLDPVSIVSLEKSIVSLQRLQFRSDQQKVPPLQLSLFAYRCKSFLESVFFDLKNTTGFSGQWHLNLLFCSNERIQQWNLQFRHKNEATDILSFHFMDELEEFNGEFLALFGGDLIVSLASCLQNCQDFVCSPEEELQRLLIHGVLHLGGYDHEKNEDLKNLSQCGEMLCLQERLLSQSIGLRFLLR